MEVHDGLFDVIRETILEAKPWRGRLSEQQQSDLRVFARELFQRLAALARDMLVAADIAQEDAAAEAIG